MTFFLFFRDYNSFFLFFLFGNGRDKVTGILTGLSSQDKTKKYINSTKQLYNSNLRLIKQR